MMSECKRILNKEVAGEGLWQTDLSKCQGQQEGEVLEIQPTDEKDDDVDEGDEAEEHRGATEYSDVEDKNADIEMAGATERSECEDIDADAEMASSTEQPDGEDVDADADMAGATEHAEDAQQTIKMAKPQSKKMTRKTQSRWLIPRSKALTKMAQWIRRKHRHRSSNSRSHCEMTGCIGATRCKIWTYKHMRNSLSAGRSLYVVQI